jgi:hypothetical protein
MFRFHTTLQSVCNILYCTKKVIYNVTEFPFCNVKIVGDCLSTLIKSHLPKPSSETLQTGSVIMPKAKKPKLNWNKLFKKISCERKKLRSENSPDPLMHQAPCSVPESARHPAESNDSGVLIVFDSKYEKTKEPAVITIDSDENQDSVNSMGDSNTLVCGGAMQHNPGSWYSSAACWAGNTCCADVPGSCSSEVASDNEPAAFKSVQSDDGAVEHAAGSSRQASKYMSMCIQYRSRALCVAALIFIINGDLE